MLLLSRTKTQRIIINDNIVITIVDVQGNKVRIGIEAPRNVTVHREEVHNAIKQGVKQATKDDAIKQGAKRDK